MITVLTRSLRLDELVFLEYGNLDKFDAVLESNSHLAAHTILDAGTKVDLPEFKQLDNIKINDVKSLWD